MEGMCDMVGLMNKTEYGTCPNIEAISEEGSSLSGFAGWDLIIGSIKALVIPDECRESLKCMLKNITGAIYITDPEGNLELISRGGLEITGYEPEELIGQPIAALFESGKFQELCNLCNKVQITNSTLFQQEAEIIRKDGRKVSLWLGLSALTDTGTGIPAEIRPRIFEPFFTTKIIGRGTGQGLPIVHSIITDKHGGTIHYETEMGKGTTFVLRLPVVSVIDNKGKNR
jgi:PAS domain S-box-containing protein